MVLLTYLHKKVTNRKEAVDSKIKSLGAILSYQLGLTYPSWQ